MAEQRTIAFSKMSGLGNDFIIIDARENALALTPAQVRQLATRDNQITKGCDQLLVLHPPKSGGNIFMQIFNADGGEVEACGNGTRAITQWLVERGKPPPFIIETLGGVLQGQITTSFTDHDFAGVSMPPPKFGWRDIPLSKEIDDTQQVKFDGLLESGFLVNVGNPHAVFFVDTQSVEMIDAMAAQYGEHLAHHPLFAQGANINFAFVENNSLQDIFLTTWERGAGLTQACGTGACAAAIAAYHRGLIKEVTPTYVFPPFAQQNTSDILNYITVSYDSEHRTLSQYGPATFEFNGMVTL